MSDNLFKKVLAFTDIHWGEDGNSPEHNDLCQEFIEWAVDEAKTRGCDLIIFGGDWHHSQVGVASATLWKSYLGCKYLNECGIPVVFIIGNHDLMYKDKRDIHSLPWLDDMENITVINEPTTIGNVTLVPWLVSGDDYKTIASKPAKYAFGHFQLPGFLMNEKYAYPDKEGILKSEDMDQLEYVFSGHFHARQKRVLKSGTEIHYIGNCFPHDFNDEGDKDRGAMVLEWDGTPEYINWPDAPFYKYMKVSDFVEAADQFSERDHIRLTQDVEMDNNERSELRESVFEQFGIKHLSIEPKKPVEAEIDPELTGEQVENVEMFTHDWILENKGDRGPRMVEIFVDAKVE